MNIPEYMVVHEVMNRMHGGSKLEFDERWKAIRHLLMQGVFGSVTGIVQEEHP